MSGREPLFLRCEMCGAGVPNGEAVWLRDEDEYVCSCCADDYAEAQQAEYDEYLKESHHEH